MHVFKSRMKKSGKPKINANVVHVTCYQRTSLEVTRAMVKVARPINFRKCDTVPQHVTSFPETVTVWQKLSAACIIASGRCKW